ncbi:sushi, nidogen and EGF-like domain-containing protein 1 [Saccostrea cucullata]|uniref:sushi, nidogen and EGF-like domain-containing protein 1 n=1 Tax=Saccostrea cuccullata TaxID=36930 RepID=UPI002ED35AD3
MKRSLLRTFLLVGGIILHWQNTLAQTNPSVGSCNDDSECIENANCNLDQNRCFCDETSAAISAFSVIGNVACQVGACSLNNREDECGPRGQCQFVSSTFDFPVCVCEKGFFGARCNDLCDRDSDCNGGRCVEKNGKKVCDCPPGAEGSQCQVTTTTTTISTTRRNRLGGVVLAVGGGIGLLALLGAAAATSAVSG